MLFHVPHHHDEHTGPAKDDATMAVTFGAVMDTLTAVSYTHLTLPTIYSV